MASKFFEKGSEEFNLFSDLWKIVQKHYIIEPDSDEYHEAVMKDCEEFARKYNSPWSHEFAAAITRAIHTTEEYLMKNPEVKNEIMA